MNIDNNTNCLSDDKNKKIFIFTKMFIEKILEKLSII